MNCHLINSSSLTISPQFHLLISCALNYFQPCHSNQDCWVQHPSRIDSHYILEEDKPSAVPISLKMTPYWLLHI